MKFSAYLLLLAVLCLTACNSHPKSPRLKVTATAVPHAEILEVIKSDLKEKGIDLNIIVVDDYNTPNRALADGEVDANFFQHPLFLEQQVRDFHYNLEVLVPVHIEPMAIYSKRLKKLNELKTGAIVAIPSDPSNQARALKLLQKSGLITLKKQEASTSVLDISDNPQQLKFVEVDSPLLVRTLDDVDLAIVSANFALQGRLNPSIDALAIESGDSEYVNVVVIRKEDAERQDLNELKKAMQSQKVKSYLLDHYKGTVFPALN